MGLLGKHKDKCPLTKKDCIGNVGGYICNDGNWVKCYTYKEYMKAMKKEFKNK